MRKISFKIIFMAIIIIYIILVILLYTFSKYCEIFKHPFKKNRYAEMIRQVQMYQCGKQPSFAITKRIYYNNEIIGVVSNGVLILKGTSSLSEVMKDIQGKKINVKFGGISKGAYSIFEKIKPQLKDVDIYYITGWSLGAMIGLQVALWIYDRTGRKTKNIFFGLPPIVDKKYKDYYNKCLYHKTIVYNHNNDPFAWPVFGKNIIYKSIEKLLNFHHVGKVKLDYPYTDYCKKYWFYLPSYHLSYF